MEAWAPEKELLCGIDQMETSGLPDPSFNYGLVTNDSAVNKSGIPVKQALIKAGYRITRLFSPEHGLQARGGDGVAQPDWTDPGSGIAVTSLYGDRLEPPPGTGSDLDAILLDLPNAGVRFYTYLWTMFYMMEWCDKEGLPLIILDRPNPLGADLSRAEGPMIMPGYHSFIGRWNVPIRFCLTLGELALLLKYEMGLERLSLQIIKTEGWNRMDTVLDWRYPFKPPSPALLSPTSYLTYPCLCFLEATNVSVGRGGPGSFEVAHAPWIQAEELIESFNFYAPPGMEALPFRCVEPQGQYMGRSGEGLRLRVTDPAVFQPVKTGMILLALLRTRYPDYFSWVPYPTLVNPSGARHFELLTGGESLKSWLENEPLHHLNELDDLLAVPGWAERVETFLLYR